MALNMQQAMANASKNAGKSTTDERNQAAAKAANERKVATPPTLPTLGNDPLAEQLAAMQAQMAQFAALLAQKDEQIAELKKSPAGKAKAEKPAPTPENMGISVKGNILTITIDLSKDTGKDTANGANRIVAQQNSAVGPYKFTHAGKDHWLSCCVARPYDNATELRKAYKASKASK